MSNKVKVAQVIALGGSYKLASKEGGVHQRTVRRWMSEDLEFQKMVKDLREEAFHAVKGGLAGLSGRSLIVMEEILNDRSAPSSVRARVALGIVKAVRDARRDEMIEDRVGVLEDLLREKGIEL